MTHKLTTEHLRRRAIVYVRQSTPTQLVQNRESQLRQYKLADYARQLGFTDVEMIDEDLGRSGSGLTERPGFQRLVSEVCEGKVGAVFSLEASRLARNGRDWHHLIELCGLVNALVIDQEGVYDPRLSNDRLLLGLRGTMSEFELSVLRQRSQEAIRQKAQRGELRFCLPVGFCWGPKNTIELDPDQRVQNAIHLVFQKFQELNSARQVLLWYREEQITVPAIGYGNIEHGIYWKLPLYNTILSILTNPSYAGAYAFGRTEGQTKVTGGRARRTDGHEKPRDQWLVLIRGHHPGYISWEQFELIQKRLSENAHMKSRMGRQTGRGGASLLVGLMRCRRCGRMMRVHYAGKSRAEMRYLCVNGNINQGIPRCVSFGGSRVDEAVSSEVVKVVQPTAIQAALQAASQVLEQHNEKTRALELELEQARYEARLTARRYESVDPDNRLVASELEARWNVSLERVQQIEARLEQARRSPVTPSVDKEALLSLAGDFSAVWSSAAADNALKQRIVRILVQEIIADVDERTGEIVLVIHWIGGRHSELRFLKPKTGQHSRCTKVEALDLVRQMASDYTDEEIVLTLNRLRLKTGAGNTWNETRLRSLRSYLGLPACKISQANRSRLNLEQAAENLHVSVTVVRRLIAHKILPATQIVPGAPWQIAVEDLALPKVIRTALSLKNRDGRLTRGDNDSLLLPGF
jgi:DNA invertase Pin-like site-specific DNA recombinase